MVDTQAIASFNTIKIKFSGSQRCRKGPSPHRVMTTFYDGIYRRYKGIKL